MNRMKITKILGIEFSNEKCAMLAMNKGKTETTKGIELSNQETITTKWMITNTTKFWKEGKSSRRKSRHRIRQNSKKKYYEPKL